MAGQALPLESVNQPLGRNDFTVDAPERGVALRRGYSSFVIRAAASGDDDSPSTSARNGV